MLPSSSGRGEPGAGRVRRGDGGSGSRGVFEGMDGQHVSAPPLAHMEKQEEPWESTDACVER
jgi:hypothetical protein